MIVYIRFFFVSLFIFSQLLGEELVRLDSSTELQSTWNIQGSPIRVTVDQKLLADLLLKKEGPKRFEFPAPFSLKMKDYRLTVRSGDETLTHDLQDPGPFLALSELRQFKDKPIEFSILKDPPYSQFPSDFSKQFADLQTMDQPFFEGSYINPLHMLLTILSHPMKVGEGFQIVRDKTEKTAFSSTINFTVRENSEELLVVDSIWLTQRQKTLLKSQKDEENPVVIFGEMKGVWTIHKKDPLLFTFEEKGAISYSLGFEELQASIIHEIVRKVATSPL
ncbi:MAG: hypothetical protein ACK5MA_02240 [Parachlamydiaceae bacterium]